MLNPALSHFRWVPQMSKLSVPPGLTVRVAPKADYQVKATFFPALSNTTFVAIGPQNMRCSTGGTPNVAIMQLDAGRSAQMYVTDPRNEDFDLGDYYACHNDAASTMVLFVTTFGLSNT